MGTTSVARRYWTGRSAFTASLTAKRAESWDTDILLTSLMGQGLVDQRLCSVVTTAGRTAGGSARTTKRPNPAPP